MTQAKLKFRRFNFHQFDKRKWFWRRGFGISRAVLRLIFVWGSAVRNRIVPRRVPMRRQLPRPAEKLRI